MKNENQQKKFQIEIAYVVKNVDFLRAMYGEKFIAVKGEEVIDSDDDDLELTMRLSNGRENVSSILVDTIDNVVYAEKWNNP